MRKSNILTRHLLIFQILLLFTIVLCATGQCPRITTRSEWGARPPRGSSSMSNPVPYTVVHHSEMAACNSSCASSVREIQDLHMDVNGWDDVGYSFLIGGDGEIFEGRGWSKVGAHAPNYNDKSIGICLIGSFMDFLPQEVQLNATKSLIECGIQSNYIQTNYVLYGHRDVRATDCPGDALYAEIENWPHKGLP